MPGGRLRLATTAMVKGAVWRVSLVRRRPLGSTPHVESWYIFHVECMCAGLAKYGTALVSLRTLEKSAY